MGLLYGCIEQHVLWLYIKSVRQSMTLIFSPEVTLAFFQNEFVFLVNAFLDQFLAFFSGVLCSTLWTAGLNLF